MHSTASAKPNAMLFMSPAAKAKMRAIEKAVYRYYNDMGKNKGHCTWGIGILAHKGVCTEEELGRKVSAQAVDQEFERRVAQAERAVRRNIDVKLNQAQFDGLVSLTYNAGVEGSRDTYDFINRGDFTGAASNMQKMIKVGISGADGKRNLLLRQG